MLKNKVRYLLLIASVGLLAILYNEYPMWIIFLTTIFLPVFLLVVLVYIYSKLEVKLVSVNHIAKQGQSTPIIIKIKNPTLFPLSNLEIILRYGNSYLSQENKKRLTVSIDSRNTTRVACKIESEHVGNLRVGLLRIRMFDYLKIFSLKKKKEREIKVAVVPDFYEVSEGFLSERSRMNDDSEYYSKLVSGDDPSEVFDIREYRYGDRAQRIHWKLSHRHDELMVKDFSEQVNHSLALIVDLNVSDFAEPLKLIDAILASALSLSYSLLRQGEVHYLVWYDNKADLCRRVCIIGEEDLYQAVDGIFKTMLYRESQNVISSYFSHYSNEEYTELFYITGEFSTQQGEALAMIDIPSKHVFYVEDTRENDRSSMTKFLIDKMSELGIEVSFIDANNVKEALRQL